MSKTAFKLSKASLDRRVTYERAPTEVSDDPADVIDGLDHSLMARVVERDRIAFTMIAERHATAAMGVARRILRNAADAEDVVQESLMRLWIFADRWSPDSTCFSSWFYRIVSNQAISRLRRKTHESIDLIEEPPDAAPGPHAQLAGREIGQAIMKAVRGLPDRQRTAILLCYEQGHGCTKAAEAMNVSISAMESLLVRARRNLRESLGPIVAELEEQ